jgi:hypothetical protein
MFRITIEGIADNQLGALVAHIGTKKYPVKVTHYLHPDQEDVKTKKKHGGSRPRRSPDMALVLTHKSPAKGTIREKALDRFKKLEQKVGPGGVTRKMFRAELDKMDCDKSTLNSLVTGGFIRHVEE